jgi:glycosyltransferase involved in cell wall biosynthesis
MPVFSIVTSFYNEPIKYIERLYNQILLSGVDWEWVVTNDFSGDDDIEEKLLDLAKKDLRVRKIIQGEKQEIFRNPSLYCRGEFIFHIDGDDLFHPLYLQHAKNWFEKFPDVVCILSGAKYAAENDAVIRFQNDDPLLTPHEKRGVYYPSASYLGRIWRSSVKIDFSKIFPDQKKIIRFNDKFIVDYLSSKGDILFLPRNYMIYTMRANSNSRKERPENEKLLAQNTLEEFNTWMQNNVTWFTKNPYFYTGEISFFEYSLPFQHISWSKEKRKCGVFGFSSNLVVRKLLIELYPDLDIIFDPDGENQKGMQIFIIDDLEEEKKLPNNCEVYYTTGNQIEREEFFKNIAPTRRSNWVLCDENLWVCLHR